VGAAAIALAAVSAFVWGAADYCGGRASQRTSALVVTVASQVLGLPVLAACVLLVPGSLAGLVDLAWGAGAGAAGFAGLVLLYRGLAMGAMAVVAPTTAVTSAAVPVAVGLALDGTPSAVVLAGVACAVVAIGLVSIGPASGGAVNGTVVGTALLAGTMFGLFFILLARTHEGSGMWPLAAARATSVTLGLTLVATLALRARRRDAPVLGAIDWRRLSGWLIAAGVGDVAANALYLLAARQGELSVVAPVAALYPVSTVLLAFAVDHERVRPIQVVGLGLAAAALVLTAV
jgi:drug/metabolite transporter (DMT)-like permease